MLRKTEAGWLAPPSARPAPSVPAPTVRLARPDEGPALLALLRAAGLSVTGLGLYLPSTLVLEAAGRPVGCVVLEPGPMALIRSLTTMADDETAETLLAAALALAARQGSREAVLLVETAAQIPARRFETLAWDEVCARQPDSALARELRIHAPGALAMRLTPPADLLRSIQ
jgi:N-acetylglutamate synthase-like GNAT family acetyltransferase